MTLRVAFYSHDTYGLGHLRRCLKIAGALAERLSGTRGLILTGSPWADAFALPPGFRCAKLPPVTKVGPEEYRPRQTGSDLYAVLAERRRLLVTELSRLEPDLVVVDNVPCGLHGEVLPALHALRASGRRARVVLALRDVLDDEAVVRRQWETSGAYDALERLYDELWVFGPSGAPACHPLPPETAHKVVFCGRLGANGHRSSASGARRGPGLEPRVLVTGGGGADAGPLVGAYLAAIRALRPSALHRIVLGPDYPDPATIDRGGLAGLGTEIVGFDRDLPAAMLDSDVVVAMAGYNTVCEALALGRRLVLVPRTWPRREQLLRARSLERVGRAALIHPADLTPERLWRTVERVLALPAPEPDTVDGARCAAERAASLTGRNAGVA